MVVALLIVAAAAGGALVTYSLSSDAPVRAEGHEENKAADSTLERLPAPAGFIASRADDSVVYTSPTLGFRIALPNGWKPTLRDDLGKGNLFLARDADPSYNVSMTQGTPGLLIERFRAPQDSLKMFRGIFMDNPRLIGTVELYRDRLPAGVAGVFRYVLQLKSGQRSFTNFVLWHDNRWYDVAFGVPAEKATSYLPVFQSITTSLEWT